jgi:type IV pilus assembly protein PilA
MFKHLRRYFAICVPAVAAFLVVASTCHAQAKPATQSPTTPWSEAMKKYPGLLPELGQLVTKLQQNVQSPAPRSESRLLPLLPESTTFYAAIPNYGDVAHQTLVVFRQELQQSPVLHDWWTHGDLATSGPKLEDSLDKFAQLHQFLGDEIIISGALDDKKDPKFVLFAELRKPGLDKFLRQWLDQTEGISKSGIHVVTPSDLPTTKDTHSTKELLVLVRPDFLVATFDLSTLRSFNSQLNNRDRAFASTPFGQRIAQEYRGGATFLAAADLQKLLNQAPIGTKENQLALQRTGFADVKYLVWKHTKVADQSVSQAELSFTSPRHGAAAWLGKPAALGSLDFVSPKAILAGTLVLSNFSQIFDDAKALSSPTNANAFAAVAGGEKALNLSLKDDLLSQLTGELTVELDRLAPGQPAWRAILKVNDASHVQKTLTTLLAAAQLNPQPDEDAGVTSYTVQVPSGQTRIPLTYAFVDSYLLIASSPELLADSVRLHRSGDSLAKSKKFLAALPPGHTANASALLYQNPAATYALQLRQFVPDLADAVMPYLKDIPLSVACLYGEDSSIREASSSGSLDISSTLIIAAIAIPNLLRSRIAANEASAVGTVRTVNTAQVTYEAMYPKKGFAANLVALGPGPRDPGTPSPEHAVLIDNSLGRDGCASDGWCTKSGYRFSTRAICRQLPCSDYLTVATPTDANTGTRSFCSTSEGVIHYKSGPPLTGPLTPFQCRAWAPLK